ncbi:MAG TPA: hypothetical protein PLR06_08580 [Cyclobacteriaceae bacterium]|nr:hypothetical protein [Cyclobacteriaceae bacterium]
MSQEQIRFSIEKLRSRYLLLRLTETVFLATGGSLLMVALFHAMGYSVLAKIIIPFSVGVVLFIVRVAQLGLFKFKKSSITSYLNSQHKDLEESADLLIEDDHALTLLQQVQKQRVAAKLESLRRNINLPHRLNLAVGALIFGAVASLVITRLNFSIASYPGTGLSINEAATAQPTIDQPIAISSVSVKIIPPAYTGLLAIQKSEFNLSVPESSTVVWTVQFTQKPVKASLILSSGDTIRLQEKGTGWECTRKIEEKRFYSLHWVDNKGVRKSSHYFKIDVIRDQHPTIKIDDLAQFSEYSLDEVQHIKFDAVLSDDYGLSNAHIIATVSKGSGESVKFREEKLAFDSPPNIQGRKVQASRTIDFHKLGMTPGDELYFYIEAFDNKIPEANHARTETWFIALIDTVREVSGFDSGMGVDLMPEYFRSQRQIIIDTEKLLAEKKKKQVTKESFNFRSNELGYDQKVLRLRYGQFLGEEFESTVVPGATEEDSEDEEADVTKKYGHTHDKENEHNLVKEKTPQKAEDHGHDESESSSNPIDAYTHKHDSEDEATFFVQSVKTRLKAALTLMWDAELQLRLYEPAKSLPFQYRILKLLQEISNDSRVYVHRNGFDPPPLKEEKRLTGDLEELKNTSSGYSSNRANQYPAIREALQNLGSLPAMDSVQLDIHQRTLLLRAGNELAGIAIEQPGEYLETLSLIKAVAENEISTAAIKPALQKIIASCWNALPPGTASPSRKKRSLHPLDRSFVKHFDLQKNE